MRTDVVTDKHAELAAKIARFIFSMGDEPSRGPTGIVGRLQYMGGKWPDNETPLGGLCEDALANVICRAIRISEATND